jgi:hypothetical protein
MTHLDSEVWIMTLVEIEDDTSEVNTPVIHRLCLGISCSEKTSTFSVKESRVPSKQAHQRVSYYIADEAHIQEAIKAFLSADGSYIPTCCLFWAA